ncbi:two-component sensor histidine kinase AdeS, partial [Acinetobacter baumannii]
AAAARAVAAGDFSARAVQVDNAPLEVSRFTQDFNTMMQQLARYDRELRASHVAMAHELRSPLTAAIGRLQGMMDGVFTPEPRQLAMVMKQL